MNKHYIKNLTLLRALAAFFVITTHSLRASEVKYSNLDEAGYFLPINLLDLGTFGVCLFFALSGCTLFISNHSKVNKMQDVAFFYFKRFMRIWPTFIVSLVIYLLFIEIFRVFYTADKNYWIARFLNEYNLNDVIKYIFLVFNITGPRDLFNGPYWSLPIEFQYYLILPFAMLLIKLKPLKYITPILISGLLYYIFSSELIKFDRNDFFKMGYMFFGGVLMSLIYMKLKIKIASHFFFLSIITLTLIAGTIQNNLLIIPKQIPFISDPLNVLGLLALILVAFALFCDESKKDFILLRMLHQYGEVSYSVYLFHMLFVGLSVILVLHININDYILKFLFVYILTLIFSYYFSILSYKLFELPSMRFAQKITDKHYRKVN